MIEYKIEIQMCNLMVKYLKPKLFWPIWITVICSGPPLNLLLRKYLEINIKNLTTVIVLSVISMVWITLVWYCYIKEIREFKKYEKKIPILIHYLYSQEKSSIQDEFIKLNDMADTISTKELLKKLKSILYNIEG